MRGRRNNSNDSSSDQQQRQRIKKMKQKQKQRLNKKAIQNKKNNIIQTNKYEQYYTTNPDEMFLKQTLKPIQKQLKQYLQKILIIKQQRKKYSIAINKSNIDLAKLQNIIAKYNNKNNYNNNKNIEQKKQLYINTIPSIQLQNLGQLRSKISHHIQLMLSQQQKTIQLVLQHYNRMNKLFNQKLKYQFLQLNSIKIKKDQINHSYSYNINEQTKQDEFQQYSIEVVYDIMDQAQKEINLLTGFKK